MKLLKAILIIVIILALLTGIIASVMTMSGFFDKEPKSGDFYDFELTEELRLLAEEKGVYELDGDLIIVDEEYVVFFGTSKTEDGEIKKGCKYYRYKYITESSKKMIRAYNSENEDDAIYFNIDTGKKTCTIDIKLSDLD